jgi:hypothetical protein
MTGTTVQRGAIAPWQCTAAYGNSNGTDCAMAWIWIAYASSLQSRSSAIWLPHLRPFKRRHCAVTGLACVVTSSKRCRHGFVSNRKASFSKGWRSLLNDTRSASLCRGTMSKSNVYLFISGTRVISKLP